jgi:alpha-beta hydrolase superfamily lysophospholipase
MVLLWFVQGAFVTRLLTGRPRPRFEEPVPPDLVSPFQVEADRINTSDGENLGVWFLRGDAHKPVVIALHGIGDSRTTSVGLMRWLGGAGDGVLAVSLRAHGDSTGDHCDFGWGARHDVVAAVEYLGRMAPGRRVVVLGSSMGAAAAIFAAKELGPNVSGYILQAPYASLAKATWVRVEHYLGFPLDYVAYGSLWLWSPVYLPVPLSAINPAIRVKDIPDATPVLFIAGGRDWEAPQADIEAMAAGRGPKTALEVFPAARHVQAWASDPARFERLVLGFIESVETGAGAR